MASRSATASDRLTVRDFFETVQDGVKADLLNGVIYMASPDSTISNDLTRFLTVLLSNFNSVLRLGGRVFVSRYAFELSKHYAPEPDVAFVRKERTQLVGKTRMKGGPDIAVEIVSTDSRDRDYGEKKFAYEKAGVTEYWIIDPQMKRAEFHRLVSGSYQLTPLESNRLFRSTVLKGFWLDVDWLLADPSPNEYACLQKILGK